MGRERDRRWRVGERRVRDIDWYLEPEAGGAIAKLALVIMRLEQGTAGFPLRREGGGEVVSGGEATSKALVGSYYNKISRSWRVECVNTPVLGTTHWFRRFLVSQSILIGGCTSESSCRLDLHLFGPPVTAAGMQATGPENGRYTRLPS